MGGAFISAASLLFAPGERPGSEQVRALAERDAYFTVSLDPELVHGSGAKEAVRWIELLANGLTFDLEGLKPGEPRPRPSRAHVYGLPAGFSHRPLEAISLRPGPHLAAGGRMLPVIRGLAGLAAHLAALPNVQAVAWHPARTWSSARHFHDTVTRWVKGGAFPGLGLTALEPTRDCGLKSEGLALFTGQELCIAPELAVDRAAGGRLGLRLLHWLVEHGKVEKGENLTGPDGEDLWIEPSDDGAEVHARPA